MSDVFLSASDVGPYVGCRRCWLTDCAFSFVIIELALDVMMNEF